MLELDTLDLALLQELRCDSRLSLRDLGAKVGLSAPSVASRLKRLEEAGIILGYTVRLSPSQFALNFEALILITVPEVRRQDFVSFMQDCLCVGSCVRLTGEFSHQLQASFSDLRELSTFVQRLNSEFGPTRTSLVLEHEIAPRPVLNLRAIKAG
ncbi:MAG: Lrp/AsnC family transcriptional regulator [Succinivibrio sp.]|nr:Lrp/AsnC family transcriptional regulator [Succinivibrio sp.]